MGFFKQLVDKRVKEETEHINRLYKIRTILCYIYLFVAMGFVVLGLVGIFSIEITFFGLLSVIIAILLLRS